MALVHQIVDFVDDINRSILKEAAANIPAHLKDAKILTAEERERLEPEQFALVMRTKEAQVLKKFPVNDEANTWLSCRYFEKTSEQLPYVAQKVAATHLKRACDIYGLESHEAINKLASNEIKTNRYDEVKSWTEDRLHKQSVKLAKVEHDGSKHFYALGNHYAMPNPEYVKKAAAYFVDHLKEFSDAEDRSVFAENVRARAKELEVSLEKKAEESLRAYASDAYGDLIGTQLKLREELLSFKPEMSQALSKLAAHRADTDPQTFAKALFLFDKKAGLTRYYDGFLSDAFKATFGTMFSKKASEYSWEDEGSGLSINAKDLEKAADAKYEKIKGYFGSTVADQLKKHAVSIFESLPKDAKETIIKIAKGAL
jgi:hypothetical protein